MLTACGTGPGASPAHSPLDRLTFGWVSALLQRGASAGQLEQSDLPPLPAEAEPSRCAAALQRSWQAELDAVAAGRRTAPSLLRALFRPFGAQYIALGLLKFWNDALNFAGPVFLNGLLRYLDSASESPPSLSGQWQAQALAPLRLPHIDPSTHLFGALCASLLVLSLVVKVSSDKREECSAHFI